jgi:hypothetical protein
MTTTVTYLNNQCVDIDRWTKGWKLGDPLRWIDLTVVPEAHPAADKPAEYAFIWWQRIEGGRGENALNKAEAPSLSVGDIVVVQVDDDTLRKPKVTIEFYACERFGFRKLDEAEVADVRANTGKVQT